jgi:hypothetical protein
VPTTAPHLGGDLVLDLRLGTGVLRLGLCDPALLEHLDRAQPDPVVLPVRVGGSRQVVGRLQRAPGGVDGLAEREQALAQGDELLGRRDAPCRQVVEAVLDRGQLLLRAVHLAQGELEAGEAVLLAHPAYPRDSVERVQVASGHELSSPFISCHVVAASVGSSMSCWRKASMRGIRASAWSASMLAPGT